MDITRLNAEELFVIIFKEVGERVATILKNNEVNGQGLLQLNDEEAKKSFSCFRRSPVCSGFHSAFQQQFKTGSTG